jgi:hypothetical protein
MTPLLASFLGVMVDVVLEWPTRYPIVVLELSYIVLGLYLLLHGFDWINRG